MENIVKPKFSDIPAEAPTTEVLDVPESEKANPVVINPNEPLFHAVADYLNITDERDYSDAVPKVERIIDYIVNKVGPKYEDVMTEVARLSKLMGKQDITIKTYKHLYRYIGLLEQKDSILKALKAWEGGVV